MIYLFTGNNGYLIKQEALKWKNAFGAKFGEENVITIHGLENIQKNELTEAFFASGLFSSKRLVIIDGFPFSSDTSYSGAADIEAFILDSLTQIPEDIIVTFLCENPDKRKSGYKTLSKVAEVKNFSLESEDAVIDFLQKKYTTSIEYPAIKKLVFFKGGNLEKSISEIEKLKISKEIITLQDIKTIILPEFEESIFVFIDTLLTKNKQNIFGEFQNLFYFSNLYALYQSIIANLRIFLYIEYLKKNKKSVQEISDILQLGKRQFLINKRHNSSYKDLEKLYNNLLDFDKNMKMGRFSSSEEQDLKNELERVFLSFL